MRLCLVIFIGLSFGTGIFAQDVKSQKDSKKEASVNKKEARSARIDSLYKVTGELLMTKQFVLEAKYLRNKMGNRLPVASILNFIAVDSNQTVIQVGVVQAVGYNGVGGITAQGNLSNWKLAGNDKRKTFDLFMTTVTNAGVYDIHMSVDYSGYASANLTSLSAGTITFEGNLVSTEDSGVYKGQSY